MSAPTPRSSTKLQLVEDRSLRAGRRDDRPLVLHVIGSRADAVRLTSVVTALERRGAFRQVIVDAFEEPAREVGQKMRAEVGLVGPSVALQIDADTPAMQTASTVIAFERVLEEAAPELVVVAGDSDAALECALVAAKHQVAVANVEAGLRSWDWSTPEEINRVVTDRLSDTLFTNGAEAAAILRAEGVPEGRIHTTGSTAVDTLRRCEPLARKRAAWRTYGVREHEYVLVTLHHRANIGEGTRLAAVIDGIAALSDRSPVVFPLHPLTEQLLERHGLRDVLDAQGVHCLPTVGYLDFLSLELGAGAIITDSNGVQGEATALGVACFTLRPSTAHSLTLTHGTNALLGEDPSNIAAVHPLRRPPTPCAIPLWDGRAGERVAAALLANYALSDAVSVGD